MERGGYGGCPASAGVHMLHGSRHMTPFELAQRKLPTVQRDKGCASTRKFQPPSEFRPCSFNKQGVRHGVRYANNKPE